MKKATYFLKDAAKAIVRSLGYRISQYRDPYSDIRSMILEDPRLIIFDVGANAGQTIKILQNTFANPIIHAFEPAQSMFHKLQQSFLSGDNIHLNRCALGSVAGVQEFKEAGTSVMSSLLEPDPRGWNGQGWKDITRRYPVNVSTIDSYCAEYNIRSIDILKTDTQGYDLEVLKGAEKMLADHRVHFIYVEINLSGMYEGQASFDEIYRFLCDRNFTLVSVYEVHARWMDGLFMNSSFKAQRPL